MKKRIIALIMAGIMLISLGGCGKESKKKEKVDKYNAVQQKVIDHMVENMTIVDEVLYGCYYDYGEEKNSASVGMIKYDLNTKVYNETKVDESGKVYIKTFYINADGQLVLNGIKNLNEEGEGTEETEESEYKYSKLKYLYDSELNQLSKEESEPVIESEDDILNSEEDMVIKTERTDDGMIINLNADIMNDKYSIHICDADGNEKSVIEFDNYVSGLYKLGNGKILCDTYVDEKEYLYEVDVEKGKLGKQIADVSKYNFDSLYAGSDDKMFFVTSSSVFQCDCSTGKIKKILNLLESDINPENLSYLFQLSDGTLGTILRSNDYNSIEIDYLLKQDENAKKKTEITVGVLYLDSELQEKIIQYNKANDDVRLVVKEYYGDDEEDYDKALSKFNSDIASGKCPDIIDFRNATDEMEQYIEKGLLEDLIPYIDKDEEINMEDFVQSVIEVYKKDNKLYTLPNDFIISGFFGATSVVGNEMGWNVDEFIKFAGQFSKGTEVMPWSTRETILSVLCTYNLNDYVNWTTGECYFDTGDFAKVLEFSKTLMTDEEYSKQFEEQGESVSEVTKIRNRQQILYGGSMTNVEDYMVAKAIFGENITFKGYPTREGNGVAISSSGTSLLAISSKSKYKEEAWEFIRQLYLPKEEIGSGYDFFPIRQDDLDKRLEESKIPMTYIDENGNEQIDYNTWGFDDLTLVIEYPKDEDIEQVKNIINSVDTLQGSNEKIAEMITEEAEPFYEGHKSAEEVAKIVQSRVSIYIKENR